jgi:hypothetical protein
MQEKLGIPRYTLIGWERRENWQDHAYELGTVELELVVAAGNLNKVGHLEHRLETDAFLSNITSLSGTIRPRLLGAVSNSSEGVDLFPRESDLVTIRTEVLTASFSVEFQGEAGYSPGREGVVISIL